MAASKYERDILLLNLSVTSVPKEAYSGKPLNERASLKECLEVIKDSFKANKAYANLTRDGAFPTTIKDEELEADLETNTLYIADMSFDDQNKVCTILVTRCDSNAQNPIFAKRDGNHVREEAPEEGESLGFSTHVCINYSNDLRGRVVLEKVGSVSRTLIFQLLNRILEINSKKKNLTYEKITKKQIAPCAFRVALDHSTQASRTLKEDLRGGRISYFELVRKKVNYDGLDKIIPFKEVTNTVRISVKKGLEEHIEEHLEKLRIFGREHEYDEVQIRYIDGKGKTGSPRFNLAREDALDTLFARVETLNDYRNDQKQAYRVISDENRAKLFESIRNEDFWR